MLRTALVRLALVIGGVLVVLAGIEIGVRVVNAFDRNVLDEMLSPRPYPPDRRLTLVHLVRPNADDRIVYELRPGVTGIFRRVPVSINSLGMRDVERPLAKRAGVFRIVGLGDSWAFGWGVERERSFYARLERSLAERLGADRVEVWNLGVPGYNTVQQVRRLERDVEALAPDLVLVHHVGNDADLPNFLRRTPDLRALDRSYAWSLVRRRWLLLKGDRVRPLDLEGVAPDPRTGRYLLDERRVPERFRPLFGRDHWLAAHRRLAALAGEHGFEVAVVLTGTDAEGDPMVADLRRLYAELGQAVIDPAERIRRELDRTGKTLADLQLSAADPHGNAEHHRLIAEEIEAWVVEDRGER